MYTQGTNPNPAEIEMQKYPPSAQNDPYKPNYTDPKNYQEQAKNQGQDINEQPPSYSNYFLHIVVFILAFCINIGIWAIDYFAAGIQSSYYYQNALIVSSYTDTTPYADSTQLFTSSSYSTNSPISVALSLVYSWVLWKFSLIVFAYQAISREEGRGLRIGTIITLILVLLAFDILLTIFALSYYNQYIFFAVFILFSAVVGLVNSKNKCGTLANILIPLLIIAGAYFIYAWILPSLYKFYIQNLSTYGALFLIVYAYPVIDLIFYSTTLALGCKIDNWLKGFFSTIHFLLLGYGVGMIMLVGYTQVEFYYLIAYFIFRNIFVNYIMRHWEKVVSNPAALPGWIVCYYVSYALSFLPLTGVGNIAVAKSFSSYMFALSNTILYGYSNPLYPSRSPPTTAISTNMSLNGNIFWLAAAIIWVGITFTQRYHKCKPTFYDLFYYLFGIHLFYLGITCSLSLPILYTNSTFN